MNNLTSQNLSVNNSRQTSVKDQNQQQQQSTALHLNQKIDEQEEIKRNLDPNIYQDRDFVSGNLTSSQTALD